MCVCVYEEKKNGNLKEFILPQFNLNIWKILIAKN
jgi:hypothetical protein